MLIIGVFSFLEVLIVLVPILLSVAFITIIERKVMGSMQRRVGPNTVGQPKFKISFKRTYHSHVNDSIAKLFLNRKVPIRPFNEHHKNLYVCKDLLSSDAVNSFF